RGHVNFIPGYDVPVGQRQNRNSKRRPSAGEKVLRIKPEDKMQSHKAQIASVMRDKSRWSQHG
ncbi:hypothetical protein A2U01_0057688, partial [Trifolium medium]|nr:hypothetical protein [Trifolium medium]